MSGSDTLGPSTPKKTRASRNELSKSEKKEQTGSYFDKNG